ncbi:hypothetical protein CCHR01_18421, partial [Colletotrichum chrysophilum]
MAFRGIVRDAAHVSLLSAAYEKHVRVNETPEIDTTFPTTAQQDRECAERIFAVWQDTSDFYEKRRAIEKKSQNLHLSKVETVLSDSAMSRARARIDISGFAGAVTEIRLRWTHYSAV